MSVEEGLPVPMEAILLVTQGKTEDLADFLNMVDTPSLVVLKRDALLLLGAVCDERDSRDGVVRKVVA